MATDETYDYSDEKNSFIENIRRNLSVLTINQYAMMFLAGLAIFLMSGLVYVLAETPEFLVSDKFGTRIIYNTPGSTNNPINPGGLSYEFVFEMFLIAGFLALGVYGLYLVKNSTAYIDDQRKAFEILAVGSFLFILAASIIFFIYMYKMTGNFPYFGGLG